MTQALATEQAPAPKAAGGARPAVTVDRLSKDFKLPTRKVHTLKERVLHPRASSEVKTLHAVDDVSFEVAEGEFFGIVGRNGSGKSTLLKCMAGIYDVNHGTIDIAGRVSPFIELGVGFNPELTARDNVIINAIMLGLTRKEARDRFDDVIAFAELENFLDLKLKNYSSGMTVRLAFSTAIQVDADVLLIDEVLAVGDAAFQAKCFDEFHRLKAAGKTIIFVTHDMGAVERFCDRAMLVEAGSLIEMGEPGLVARRYNEVNFGRVNLGAPGAAGAEGPEVAVSSGWFENASGERILTAQQRDSIAMCCEIEAHKDLQDPMFLFTLRNDARHVIFATSTQYDHEATGTFAAGERAVIRLELPLWLAPSRYTLTATVSRTGVSADVLTSAEDVAALVVDGPHRTGGVVDIPYEFAVQRR